MADEPGRCETHETHRTTSRDWVDKKHEPDGTSSEHVDLDVNHDLDDNDEDAEEVEYHYFRMNVTDATAKTAMLRAARARARTNANKHRETRARRAELRSLRSGGEANVGYFKTGINKGANPVAQCQVRTPQGSRY